MRLVARMFAVALLAAGAVAGPAAVAANASGSVTIDWVSDISSSSRTYPCTGTDTYNGSNGWYVAYVSNGCHNRVWLHGDLNGDGASYCVNPGAITYGAIGSYEQILVSGTQTACDYGVQGQVQWIGEAGEQTQPFQCIDGATLTGPSPLLISWIDNPCQVRIWIHDPNGNAIQCVNPHSTYTTTAIQFGDGPVEFQITANQAPCSAGNP